MEGLIGLRNSINDRETALRDLSILERMDQRMQQDQNEEIKAQQQEQLLYEKMYQQADMMLAKDRKKINMRMAVMQGQLRRHLSETGGNKKDFLSKGGFTILGEMANDIVYSDEAIRFKENKTNLAKILEAKEKGLGHLIAPKDLKSAEDYQRNPDGGTITYSGIMSEVEIPPSNLFDYGKEIPIENIISYGSNMMKIKNNYAIQYPDDPEPTWEKLVQFAKRMGYGGMGSNTDRLRAQAMAAAKKAEYDKKNSTKNSIGLVNELVTAMSSAPANLTVEQINKPIEEGGYGGNYMEYAKSKNEHLKKYIGEKSPVSSIKRTLDKEGFDFVDALNTGVTMGGGLFSVVASRIYKKISGSELGGDALSVWESVFNSNVGLKESYKVAEGSEGKIAQRIFSPELGYQFKDGMLVDFEPTEDMYRMDGVKISKGNKLSSGEYKGNYKVKGFFTAMKGYMDSENDDALLIDVYDRKGEIDKNASKSVHDGYTKGTKFTTVLALENEDGIVFYKEVPIDRPDVSTIVANALGSDNDMTQAIEQQNRSLEDIRKIAINETEEQIEFSDMMKDLDKNVFESEAFKMEGEEYFGGAGARHQNRYNLMKSFYTSFDYVNNVFSGDPNIKPGVNPRNVKQFVDANVFSTIASIGGIDDYLKDYSQGNDPRNIIKIWLENVNLNLPEGSLEKKKHEMLASKWLQAYELL